MQRLKRGITLFLAVILCVSALSGCAEEETEALSLSVCVGGGPGTLDPIYAEEIADQTVLTHLYENLMRVTTDETGNTTVVNGMAKSVEHEENHDGTVTYTFRLRGAEWSDGRTVTASDFVYAWRRLANPSSNSPYAELLSLVVGYDEARAAEDMSLLQVTAKNNTTLVVNLSGHYDWFLSEVCTSPATMPLRQDVVAALKEAAGEEPWWSDPAALVTNGAYQVTAYDKTDSMTLSAAESYYEKLLGPQDITFRFAASDAEAWTLYEAELVDMVWPMAETRIQELAEDETWSATPELAVHTVLFNNNHEVLSDPLIRQAMSMVIDRNALAETAGLTARPAEGLVPYGVPENEEGDFRTTGGALLDNDPEIHEERCEQAKIFLEESSYSGDELEYLYIEEGTNGAVAQALCQHWQEVLQMQVTPRGVTAAELWTALRSGEYMLAGVELDAVGNDAECFLMEWTSDSQNNVIGYTNSAYDTLMAIIAGAADGAARMGCLHDAEVLLLSDYALIPLYTHGVSWELRDTLMGACRDARGWFSFSGVKVKPTD